MKRSGVEEWRCRRVGRGALSPSRWVSWLPLNNRVESSGFRCRAVTGRERDPRRGVCALAGHHLATAGRGRSPSVSPRGPGREASAKVAKPRRAVARGRDVDVPARGGAFVAKVVLVHGPVPFVGSQVYTSSTTVRKFLRGNSRLLNLLRMRLHLSNLVVVRFLDPIYL